MEPLPDVLFLDLMMPGKLNGWDVLYLKQHDPHLHAVPVIILTAAPPHEARARPLEGASIILKKPFSIPHLLQVIERMGGQKKEEP
jgi:CheY-like chemotaxis protein